MLSKHSKMYMSHKNVTFVLDAQDTRYHVVRAAARNLGWCIDNGDRVDVPNTFYGVEITQTAKSNNTCNLHGNTTVSDNNNNSYAVTTANSSNSGSNLYNNNSKGNNNSSSSISNDYSTKITNRNKTSERERYHQASLEWTYEKRQNILQVIWLDKSVVGTRIRELQERQLINHFVGMDVIARKATLFKRLSKIIRLCNAYLKAFPEDRDELKVLRDTLHHLTPRSFSSVTECSALSYYVDTLTNHKRKVYFIVKPNKGCQGRGIRITSDPISFLESVHAQSQEEYLIQEYVDRPLLIEGYKFDLRLYVLLKSVMPHTTRNWDNHKSNNNNNNIKENSVNAKSNTHRDSNNRKCEYGHKLNWEQQSILDGIELYVHNEGLVRMCTERYELPCEDNIECINMHLSNSTVNKRYANYFDANDTTECNQNDKSKVSYCSHCAKETNSHFIGCKDELNNNNNNNNNTCVIEGNTTNGFKRDLKFLKHYINARYNSNMAFATSDEEHKSCMESSCSVWEKILGRIYECIVLTVLSGVQVLRQEFAAHRANRFARGNVHCCFELLGFDILIEEETLQPILMEVNHSPSLFCYNEFDFNIKEKVIRDTLMIVTASYNNKNNSDYNNNNDNNSNMQEGKTAAENSVQETGFVQLLPCMSSAEHIGVYEHILELSKNLH